MLTITAMTPVLAYFSVLCSVAVSLCLASLLYLLLAVWPEIRALLRLRCLALRVEMEGQAVDLVGVDNRSDRVRRKRRGPVVPVESRDADVSARSVEDWRYEHGLGHSDPLPDGYEVRGGVVVAVRSNNPLVRDPAPVPLLRIR
jgi:hypothetical protein